MGTDNNRESRAAQAALDAFTGVSAASLHAAGITGIGRKLNKQVIQYSGRGLNDMGNAERLAAAQWNRIIYVRYSGDSGEWRVLRAGVYEPDLDGSVDQMCRDVLESLFTESLECADPFMRRQVFQHALRSQSRRALDAMKSLARSLGSIPVSYERLDNNPMALACWNGKLDLSTGDFEQWDPDNIVEPDDYITRRVKVDYSPDAECPRFVRFLDEITDGDDELAGFLQRLIGYCLTGDTRDHILPILCGTGRNGKSTLVDTVLRLLGDYAAPAPEGLLTSERSEGHPTRVAMLRGKRLIVGNESEENAKLRLAFVKSLTGDDYLTGRFCKQDFFTFKRTHKTLLVTNHRPLISETSDAIWRRVLLVPFDVSFAGREDRELSAKLDAELPGILAWAVRGCLDWQRGGLNPPARVVAATGEYRQAEDPLAPFVAECLALGPMQVSRKKLWTAYVAWIERKSATPVSPERLYNHVRAMEGVAEYRRKDERGFTGVGLDGVAGFAVAG